MEWTKQKNEKETEKVAVGRANAQKNREQRDQRDYIFKWK